MYADLEVGRHRLKTRREGLGVTSAVDEDKARRLRSENVAEVSVGGMLFGAEGAFHAVNFILGCRDGRFDG